MDGKAGTPQQDGTLPHDLDRATEQSSTQAGGKSTVTALKTSVAPTSAAGAAEGQGASGKSSGHSSGRSSTNAAVKPGGVRRFNASALSGRTAAIVRGQLRPPKSGSIEPPTKAPSLMTFTPAQTVAALAQFESTFDPNQEENQGVLAPAVPAQMDLPEWHKFQGVIARARARAMQKHVLIDHADESDYQGSLLDKIQTLKSKIQSHVVAQAAEGKSTTTIGEQLQAGQLAEQEQEQAQQAAEQAAVHSAAQAQRLAELQGGLHVLTMSSADLTATEPSCVAAQADQFERSVDTLVQALERDHVRAQEIPAPVDPSARSVDIPLTQDFVRAAMAPLSCPDLDHTKSCALGASYLQPPMLQDSPVPYSNADEQGAAPAASSLREVALQAATFSHDGPVPEGLAHDTALAQVLKDETLRPYQTVPPSEGTSLSEVLLGKELEPNVSAGTNAAASAGTSGAVSAGSNAAVGADESAHAADSASPEVYADEAGAEEPHSSYRGGYLPCYVLYDFAQDRFLLDEGSCRLLGLTYTGDWVPHALIEQQVEFIDKDAMLSILFDANAGSALFSHIRICQGSHQGERLFFSGSVVLRDDTGIALLVSGYFARIQADFIEYLAKIKKHSSAFDIDAYTGEIHYGAAIYQILGLRPEEKLPRSLIEFEKRYIHPDDLLIYRKQGDVISSPSLGDYYESIFRLKHRGGYYIWCIDRGLVVERKRSGRASRIIGTTTNIDVVRSNFERLKRTIYQDPLTGLHNRLYLNTRNKFFTMEESQPLSLVYVDISGLKVINDYLGHAKGDALVKLAVSVLSQDIYLDHELVRLSGDEFLLIFPCCGAEQCAAHMERFISDLHARNAAHEFPLPVFMGYGIATLNEIDDGDTFMRCEQRADERLKRYKQQHHDEIYAALRSFVEEMLGYSIDLTDNRVLDYIDQPGSPPATVAKLSAAPLSEPVAEPLVEPGADASAVRPSLDAAAVPDQDRAADAAETVCELDPSAPDPEAELGAERAALEPETGGGAEGYQVFTGSVGAQGSQVPLTRQYPNSALFTSARLSAKEQGEQDD